MIRNKITTLMAVAVAHLISVTLHMPSSPAADVLVSIGDGSGSRESNNNKVTVSLDNAGPVRGLELKISDQGNFLACKGCQAVERASDCTCNASEHRFGYAAIELFCTGSSIAEGTGPVLNISYDVKERAASGDCYTLSVADKNSFASDANKRRLSLESVPGDFCITGGSGDETTTVPATTTASGGTTSIQSPAATSVADSSSNTPSRPDGGGIVPSLSDRGEIVPQAPDSLGKEGSGTLSTPRRSSTATSIRAQTPSRAQQAEGLQDSRATTTVPPSSPYRLVISPSVAQLYSGDMMQLAAKTLLEDSEVEGRYAWQLVPPSTIGSSISAAGEFSAGNNPNDTPVLESIYVTDTLNGNSTEIALITVEKLDRSQDDCSLRITPSSATVQPGKSITFAARVIGASCKEGSLAWRINSTIGSRIDENGRYTAGDNQSGHNALDIILIKDAVNGMSADAIITVEATGPDSNAGGGAAQAPHFARRSFILFAALAAIVVLLGIAIARKFKR